LSEIILTLEGIDPLQLYGYDNAKLNLLKNAFPEVTITSRGLNLKLKGEKHLTQKAKAKVEAMVHMIKTDQDLTTQSVIDLLENEQSRATMDQRASYKDSKIIKDKVDPYLRPLYDSLEDMIKGEKLNFFMENRTIEVAPLALYYATTNPTNTSEPNITKETRKSRLSRYSAKAVSICQVDLSHRRYS